MIGLHIETSRDSHFPVGGHPENVNRLLPTLQWLDTKKASRAFQPIPVSEHTLEPIERVHSQRYIKNLRQTAAHGPTYLDPDTYVCSGSFDAAQNVINIALSAVDAVMTGPLTNVFVLCRPPGHHAEHDRAMGFCLFNNVAVAAQYLVDKYRFSRVAIVDFDVHHGNGTQHLFYDRSDVMFISTHQFPYYPGTGAASETGTGRGKGYTLNVPLQPGAGDSEFHLAFEQQIVPALRKFKPEFLLVSAGFDAHHLDPLGGLNVTGEGFGAAAAALSAVAGDFAGGKMVSLLEGGYHPQGNLDAISNYLNRLDMS